MEVPLLDLQAQYAAIKEEMIAAVGEVLESQRFIGGPKIAELEEKVAALSGCQYGVGVSSGTDALLASLMALGIGPGDEVITTPFTFFSTVGGIVRVGAKPVFVDIDRQTYNINASLIDKAVTPRTRAILPVHLFGQMADMEAVMEIAKRNDLHVIEDAAQSITSSLGDRKAGSFAAMGCFSFFPSKNLGGIGDGGMVVTNDKNLYDRLMVLRNHGSQPKYYHEWVGGNFRLDAIQAAALLVKLPYLEQWSRRRREHAAYYNEKLTGTEIVTPTIQPGCQSIYNQYTIRIPRRDECLEYLRRQKIGCEIYYPLGLHLQKCFQNLGHKKGDFPETETAAKEVLALPVYPELTRAMQDYAVEHVLSFPKGG